MQGTPGPQHMLPIYTSEELGSHHKTRADQTNPNLRLDTNGTDNCLAQGCLCSLPLKLSRSTSRAPECRGMMQDSVLQTRAIKLGIQSRNETSQTIQIDEIAARSN